MAKRQYPQKFAKGSNMGNSKANAEKRAAGRIGRPPLGEEKYHSGLCQVVITMGAEGKSETEMAVHGCGVVRATMRGWAKKHPDFAEALSLAHELSRSWWEDKGRRNLARQGFNTNLYNKIISCRFRDTYSERLAIEGGDKPIETVTRIERVIVKASNKTPAHEEKE